MAACGWAFNSFHWLLIEGSSSSEEYALKEWQPRPLSPGQGGLGRAVWYSIHHSNGYSSQESTYAADSMCSEHEFSFYHLLPNFLIYKIVKNAVIYLKISVKNLLSQST